MPGLRVLPDKQCAKCAAIFNRVRMPSGRMEDAGVYLRRNHCSLSCANTRTQVKLDTYLWRARKHRGPECECCGFKSRLHVHHCDQDQTNNDLSNLQTLCQYCHDFWHAMAKRHGKTVAGRMPRLVPPTPQAIGWTDLKQSVMAKYHSALQQHSEFSVSKAA